MDTTKSTSHEPSILRDKDILMRIHHKEVGWFETDDWKLIFENLLGVGARVEMWNSLDGTFVSIKITWPERTNKEITIKISKMELESSYFSHESLAKLLAKEINEQLDEAKMIDRLNELKKEFGNEYDFTTGQN